MAVRGINVFNHFPTRRAAGVCRGVWRGGVVRIVVHFSSGGVVQFVALILYRVLIPKLEFWGAFWWPWDPFW